jgi:glycosyltransferase involved in cell wall biosynthesis
MAMGKAVIASNTRSHREGDIIQHEHNGLLVPPEDPAALRAAILRLLGDDDLRRRLGQAARATVESGLNLDRYIDEMVALVESVARERGVLPAAKPRRHLVETA